MSVVFRATEETRLSSQSRRRSTRLPPARIADQRTTFSLRAESGAELRRTSRPPATSAGRRRRSGASRSRPGRPTGWGLRRRTRGRRTDRGGGSSERGGRRTDPPSFSSDRRNPNKPQPSPVSPAPRSCVEWVESDLVLLPLECTEMFCDSFFSRAVQ